jgi:hypothetical protein
MGCGASKIYPIKFNKTEIEYKTNKCVICLESLDSGKITLPCGHSYHCACILEWFDKKLDCPYCKKKMKWHKE